MFFLSVDIFGSQFKSRAQKNVKKHHIHSKGFEIQNSAGIGWEGCTQPFVRSLFIYSDFRGIGFLSFFLSFFILALFPYLATYVYLDMLSKERLMTGWLLRKSLSRFSSCAYTQTHKPTSTQTHECSLCSHLN